MTNQYHARVQFKKDTSANWTAANPVLLDGEEILVVTEAGAIRRKTGDGVKTYTQLPFDDEAVRNLVNGKQDTITGTRGQFVGFNDSGDPVACGEESSLYREVKVSWENALPSPNPTGGGKYAIGIIPTYNYTTDQYEYTTGTVKTFSGTAPWIPDMSCIFDSDPTSYYQMTEEEVHSGQAIDVLTKITCTTMLKDTYTKLPDVALRLAALCADDIVDSDWNRLSDKQNKLTGTSSQIVGFDTKGNMVAKDDPNLPRSGGTMTGVIDVDQYGIKCGDAKIYAGGKYKTEGYLKNPGELGPVMDSDPATNAYCNSIFYAEGLVAMNKQVKGVADPTDGYDAVNKLYVDAQKPSVVSVTLAASDWVVASKSQTVTVAGVVEDESAQLIHVSPAVLSLTELQYTPPNPP